MQENNQVQQSIEQNAQNTKLFFFNEASNNIKALKEKDAFETSINAIREIIEGELEEKALDTEQYKLLGSVSYLIGLDFYSQVYINKETLQNISKRLKAVDLDLDYIDNNILPILKNIKSEHYKGAKDTMVGGNSEILKFSNIKEKTEFTKLRVTINKMIDNCIIPIQYAHSISDLKVSDLTYDMILKINNIFSEYGSYNGSALKTFKELYGNPLWIKLIESARDRFNYTKFALLFFDSIASISDYLNANSELKITVNFENYTDTEYEKFLSDYKLSTTEEPEPNNTKGLFHAVSNAETEHLMTNCPDKFLVITLENLLNKQIESSEDIVSAIDTLLDSEEINEYISHIYMYISKVIQSPARKVGEHYLPDNAIINISEGNKNIVDLLNDKIKSYGTEYKKLVEENCEEIPANQLDKIRNLINILIGNCYLKTQDQKQYLSSQLIENTISTWNHFQQIMSIIETCDIDAKHSINYSNLFEYINEHKNIKVVFENAPKITEIETKMEVYRAFKNWYSLHIPQKIEETPEEN